MPRVLAFPDQVLMAISPEDRRVTTYLRQFRVDATRPPTPENVAEAEDQGYRGLAAVVCWQSLVEHELLHVVVGRRMSGESVVLAHESGARRHSYRDRLYEEAVVLALQHASNLPGWSSSLLDGLGTGLREYVCGWLEAFRTTDNTLLTPLEETLP